MAIMNGGSNGYPVKEQCKEVAPCLFFSWDWLCHQEAADCQVEVNP